jgi:hypothetical protein
MKNNIFVNTIPHSGTHLVTSILDQLDYRHTRLFIKFYSKKPYYRRWQKASINWRTSTEIGNYLRFYSNREVFVSVSSPRIAKAGVVDNLLSKVKGGEYVIGHMPYSKEGEYIVGKSINKTITIIRDPRDMILSMLSHISTRPTHMAHSYLFKVLSTDSERIEAIVCGYDNQYGHLTGALNMYNSMLKWKGQSHNITLKFEDLVGEKGGGQKELQFNEINRIVKHLDLDNTVDDNDIVNIGLNAFGKTSTFRNGLIGKWKDAFNSKDKEMVKKSLGSLLIGLNYESNNEW